MIKLYSCSACNTRLCRVVISNYDEHLDQLGFDADEFWSGPPVECLSSKRSMKPRWREC